MAHTIKDCEICGKDYMYHNNDWMYQHYCQDCSDEHCLVLHDVQSDNNASIVLEFDYLKHKLGNPILFKGTRDECKEWITKNSPITDDIQDIGSTVALGDYKNWIGTPFENTHIDNTVQHSSDDENFLALCRASWKLDSILKKIQSFKNLIKVDMRDELHANIKPYEYTKTILEDLNEVSDLIKQVK